MNALWMLVSSLFFASMSVCVKLSGSHFNLGQTVLMRGFVPVLMIGGWILLNRHTLRTRHWRSHLYRSTAGTLGMLLNFSAIAHLPLATAVTLNNTSALFMAIILSFRQRPPAGLLLALALGFAGVAMILQPSISSSQWLGGIEGLGAGLLACIAQLNLRELGRAGEPEWRTVFVFSSTCTLMALPFAALQTQTASDPATLQQWIALIGVGALGGFAQLSLSRAFSTGKTLVTASLSYATVVFSAFYGVLIWHDRLGIWSWLGIATVVVASLIATHPKIVAPAPDC